MNNEDDIDWMSAASDFGLVALCREMDALAKPFDMASLRRRVRKPHARVKPRGPRATADAATFLYQ